MGGWTKGTTNGKDSPLVFVRSAKTNGKYLNMPSLSSSFLHRGVPPAAKVPEIKADKFMTSDLPGKKVSPRRLGTAIQLDP